jgi:hypothetical protein
MNVLIEQQEMPGKKTRTRSRRGRRMIRKTRHQTRRQRQRQHKRLSRRLSHRKPLTRRKHRGGNIFLDSRRTPAGSTIAGPGNPDLEGGPGTMQEYTDYHAAFEDEEAGPAQGV